MAAEPKRIDYGILADALHFYEARGYTYKEVPWVVSREATLITLPPDRSATTAALGDLVGSAEQSFIELLLRGETLTKHCAITPCFRDEPVHDEFHHQYFMKCELFDGNATSVTLQNVINDASAFFSQYLPVHVIQTGPDTYDIVSDQGDIELGSYGYRSVKGQQFIYGTGVALPRLTTVLSL